MAVVRTYTFFFCKHRTELNFCSTCITQNNADIVFVKADFFVYVAAAIFPIRKISRKVVVTYDVRYLDSRIFWKIANIFNLKVSFEGWKLFLTAIFPKLVFIRHRAVFT